MATASYWADNYVEKRRSGEKAIRMIKPGQRVLSVRRVENLNIWSGNLPKHRTRLRTLKLSVCSALKAPR
jgi:hypothetical protein